jgi:ABC-type amino acid transport substrate-binding protein
MAEIQRRGRLRIGIPGRAPPIGWGDRRGMSVSLGQLVADALDVAPEIAVASSQDLLARAERGLLDLAFPALPLTEARFRRYVFTDPYVVAHQRLLVAGALPAELRTICAYGDPKTGADLLAVVPTARVLRASLLSRCLELLSAGRVDAVTADDVFLEYLRSRLEATAGGRAPEIVGDDLSTVGYGAVVSTGAADLAAIVERVLVEAESDGTWAQIYSRWVGAPADEPPELSAEEAAALFPIGAS